MRAGRLLAIAREALASALSQRSTSGATIGVIAAMCIAVILTAGSVAGSEQRVLASLDAAGTRSIVVRAQSDAGLTTDVLSRIQRLSAVEWVGAFGPSFDVVNRSIPGGKSIGLRAAYSRDFSPLHLGNQGSPGARTYLSRSAATTLGMPSGIGGLATDWGGGYAATGLISVPAYLGFLQPLAVTPAAPTGHKTVAVLVVLAKHASDVAALTPVVESELGISDPSKVTISTSSQLATLRGAIQTQLGASGWGLVVTIVVVTGGLICAILFGVVLLRRKDFGRRRALGASQKLVIGLLLTQTALLAIVGAVLGCIVGGVGLLIRHQPLPSLAYFAAVGLLSVVVAAAAAVAPAAVASRRDPLHELRVP